MIANLEAAVTAAGERMLERLQALSRFSDSEEWLERRLFSPASEAAAHRIKHWMEAGGLVASEDALTNVYGHFTSCGVDQDAPCIYLGSHYDTVINAGAYDGALGVLLGLAAVEILQTAAIALRHRLGVLAFCDEEGVRFQSTFLGSAFLSGQFEREWLHLRDGMGKSLGEWLIDRGESLDALFEAEPIIRAQDYFLEAHIEQGPVLESLDKALGIFTSIASQIRAEVVLEGKAGHAGTTPASLRRDALSGAAEIMLLVESLGRQDEARRLTVGRVEVVPNASNVIPGNVTFSLDLRQPYLEDLERTYAELGDGVLRIARQRGLECELRLLQKTGNIVCDAGVVQALHKACSFHQKGETPQLLSGAGHDAMKIAAVCPTALLAVRCREGLSHHPEEYASPEDCLRALRVLVEAILLLDSQLP